MKLAASLFFGLMLVAQGHAGEAVYADLADEVPGHPGVAYLDLVRQIAPDLTPADSGAIGHLAAPLRYLEEDDPSAVAGEYVVVDGVVALPIRAGGKVRLALLVDLGDGGDRAESFTALALFDDSPKPKLLDVADVSYDRFTAFDGAPLLDLSPDDQAVVVRNTHSNSNQAYDLAVLLFVRGDRISPIGTVTSFSDWDCDFEHLQNASFEAVPDPGAPYAAIRADVSDVVRVREEEGICGYLGQRPEPRSRTVSATYRWDAEAQKFGADSDALETLAREDEDRF